VSAHCSLANCYRQNVEGQYDLRTRLHDVTEVCHITPLLATELTMVHLTVVSCSAFSWMTQPAWFGLWRCDLDPKIFD